jgi:DNA-binding PadR family transcriptional regulator
MTSTISSSTPLREPTFFILLSLAEGQKHGYAILKDVESLSQGKIRLSTGTLYEALSRLLEQGLIERVLDGNSGELFTAETGEPSNRPRKAYLLTGAGRCLLQTEMERLQQLVHLAQLRLSDEGL